MKIPEFSIFPHEFSTNFEGILGRKKSLNAEGFYA